jgi:hypothetical protein
MFDQQLDLDGGRHDIAPAHARLRLFEPAPAQLEGQTWLALEDGREGRTAREVHAEQQARIDQWRRGKLCAAPTNGQ